MREKVESMDIKSILIPLAIALFFLFWGYAIFMVVGDRGPGPWFYGSQPDVPGQSPYSTHRARLFPGSGPEMLDESIQPQHVNRAAAGARLLPDSAQEKEVP